jgi:polyphosphate glucokinase
VTNPAPTDSEANAPIHVRSDVAEREADPTEISLDAGGGEGVGVEGEGRGEADGAATVVHTSGRPFTLAIDIGGTGLKASVLDAAGAMVADRVRVPTTYPMPPSGEDGMVSRLAKLVATLPDADRISAGFPGMVRSGVVLSAYHFVTKGGPGTEEDPALVKAWYGFDLAAALTHAIGKPSRVANDADVQGLAVVAGTGLELVLTLGTGFGSSFFLNGALMPHLEIAHQPFRKGETYNQQVGEAARKEIGGARWNQRVLKAIANMEDIFFSDHLYIGGGNARRIDKELLSQFEGRVTIVDNSAGILGGIKLWEGYHLGV